MELERNETSITSNFMNMIDKEAKKFESTTGEVELLINREWLEREIAEMELFYEIEKGDWSLENEPTSTRADFQRKYGIVK